ncbi:MAG: hypothetical protein HeimC2_28340 [Candidatus Heimdallarchaeota archaeon LC_2]|nr:MAG: hypothetical protein HeimC2_28340 [Candidatus Heimdallarchaeota archaeon LC_2]
MRNEIIDLIGVPENETLIYFAIPPGPEKLGICISALSNTKGGYIIFGVKVTDDSKIKLLGISKGFRNKVVVDGALEKLNSQPILDYKKLTRGSQDYYCISVDKSKLPILTMGKYYIREGIRNIEKKMENKTVVFVSHSHNSEDVVFVDLEDKTSLISYLKGLEIYHNFEFWIDKKIVTGDIWDKKIQSNIKRSHIALLLISEPFLNSKYIMDKEVNKFIKQRKEDGMVIFPIILSACSWKEHDWLSSTHFQPRDGKTLTKDYKDRGDRDELYQIIRDELKAISENFDE